MLHAGTGHECFFPRVINDQYCIFGSVSESLTAAKLLEGVLTHPNYVP